MDIIRPERRSALMSRIRGKDTGIEVTVRKGLHRLGFRYQLGGARLPGRPDIVLAKYRTAIFVHGCFWHGHGCHLFKWPSTRPEFWRAKIGRNCEVDRAAESRLSDDGWRVAVIWECALKGRERLPLEDVISTCADWLNSDQMQLEIRGG